MIVPNTYLLFLPLDCFERVNTCAKRYPRITCPPPHPHPHPSPPSPPSTDADPRKILTGHAQRLLYWCRSTWSTDTTNNKITKKAYIYICTHREERQTILDFFSRDIFPGYPGRKRLLYGPRHGDGRGFHDPIAWTPKGSTGKGFFPWGVPAFFLSRKTPCPLFRGRDPAI